MIARFTDEERVQHSRQMAGGFMLRLIYRHYQTKTSLSQFYDFGDVMKVTFRGDTHLADFYNQWITTLNGLMHPEYLHADVKKDMFLKQIQGSKVLQFDLEYYNRLKDDSPEKSYEWLAERVENRIRDDRTRLVEQQLGYGGHTPAALAATTKGDGKGKGKGKSDGSVVCRFHAAGNCRFGDTCSMSHVIPRNYVAPEPKGKGGDKGSGKSKGDGKGKSKGKGKGKGGDPNSSTPCFRWNEGKCDTPDCTHRHEKMTTEEWANKKTFDDKRALKRPKSPGAAATGPCPDWTSKGSCALGDTCPMKHDPKAKGTPKAKAKAKPKAKAEARE